MLTEALNAGGRAIGASGESARAFQLLAENLVEPGDLTKRGRELLKLNQYRFLNDVLARGSVRALDASLVPGRAIPVHNVETATRLRQAGARLESKLNVAEAAWRDQPPSLGTPPRDEQDLASAKQRMQEHIRKGLPVHVERQLPTALATYADYFPGKLGEEVRTARSSLMNDVPRLRDRSESRSADRRENFTRARSYGGLRGFAKVGGVLIGLEPTGGQAPDIIDLQWNEGGDGVGLMLRRDDGKVLSFGPFRADIIRLALAYAADGRPVTVTMPSAGQIGRQVLLHPTLVDTALGCHARHLD